jgi:hypothetical protein
VWQHLIPRVDMGLWSERKDLAEYSLLEAFLFVTIWSKLIALRIPSRKRLRSISTLAV